MGHAFEERIRAFTEDRTPANLTRLEEAFVEATFMVIVGQDVTRIEGNRWDVPAICVRAPDGVIALPVFSSMEDLCLWRPDSKYIERDGRQVLQLALSIKGVERLIVNPGGIPRGAIPASDFERLLAIPHQG